jgi:transposase
MYIGSTMCPEELCADLTAAYMEIDTLKKDIRLLSDENRDLKDRIAWFERQIFGQKTERYIHNDQQEELPLDVTKTEVEVKTETVTYERTTVKKNPPPEKEDGFPAHLPRVNKVIEPDFDTSGYVKLTDKITEELHYKPAEFYVLRIIRPVLKKVVDGEVVISTPELPPRCIDKGKAGSSLVAQLLVTKCVDHNPLYRFQEQIKRYCNLDIPYSTLNGWFAQGAFWLESLIPAMQKSIYESGYFQMDETTIRVMIEPTAGKSHLGYMVQMLSPELKIVTFHYMETRNQKNIKELIPQTYKGTIHTDGLNIYDFLDFWDGIIHTNCHSHSRRGFKDALDNDPVRARWMLDRYKALFEIEHIAKRENLSAQQRLQLRLEMSQPIIEEMKDWLDTTVLEVTPKSLIGKAIGYTLSRWKGLTRFLENGIIELSTNLVENGFRKMALGKRNYMFTKSEQGARNLATIYSVLGTCYLHGINPFDYLCVALEKLPARNSNDITDLLPMNWKPPTISK